MRRTFAEHQIRASISLDQRWEFVTAEDRPKNDRGLLPKAYPRSIHVPSCWESLPGLENYRGKAWLRTQIGMAGAAALRLVFGGVSHTATVYIDGKEVGHHYDAFSPFEVIVPGLKPGNHELVVAVDNSFGAHSALHIENDYYTYGGITRPVDMQLLPHLSVENVQATPVRVRGRWFLDLAIRCRAIGCGLHRARLKAHLGATSHELGDIEYEGSGLLASTVRIPAGDITPWSPASPQLYELSLELIDDEAPAMLDDLITRVGFREVKVKGKKLLLNGEEFKLCGYNRHEDHPQFGCAIPLEAMIHDLELIRASGANFVRTCHYPNDQRFLDCCDELGICIWEENHARDVPFDQPAFDEQIEQSTREMVHWHFNHPSIIIWGCLNECDSVSKPGRKVHEHCLGLLKELDGSRPVTFASNKQVEDICLDLVDIVSWNLYPGWYGGSIESVEDRFKELYQWLQSPKSGAKGKPLIMSEFGGGAIYGNHDRNRPKWSEEFQADLLDECLRIYLAHPGIIGSAIWQFCDCRVTEGWSMRRPNTINNKGVVDRYRRPKLSFERVTARFQEARERWGV